MKNYKEFMSNSKNKALVKLGGYFIFFLIIFVLALIANGIEKTQPKKNITTTTTQVKENFNLKIDKLLENNHNINYKINGTNFSYTINGNIKDKILNGYLENNDEIKKIKLIDNTLYEINNDIDNIVNYNFDSSFINIYSIINLIENERAYIKTNDLDKIYEYNINIDNLECLIIVNTNNTDIVKITINYNEIEYILNFDN